MKTGFNGIYQINKNTNGRYQLAVEYPVLSGRA